MKSIALSLATILFVSGCVSAEKPQTEKGEPYQLTPQETYIVRDYVSSEFYLPRAVHMHPMNASKSSDGVVTVCGVADALGQEGPGETIGYRPYIGILVPQKQAFAVVKLADGPTADMAIQLQCEAHGAPIIFSDEVKRFKALVYGG